MRVRRKDEHIANTLGAFATSEADRIHQALSDEARATGAGPAALTALATWEATSIEELSQLLALSHSGTVRLVDRLVSSGMVSRTRGPDRRTAALSLTARGKRTAARLNQRRRDVILESLARLKPAERDLLGSLVAKMLESRPRTGGQARHECRLCDHSVCVGTECPIGNAIAT